MAYFSCVRKKSVLCSVLFLYTFGQIILTVKGHGYMVTPVPRQIVRNDNPFYGTGDIQSLAAGGPGVERTNGHGLCGDVAARKAFMAPSEYGPQLPSADSVYLSGQYFDMKVKVTAHHKGWFEFRLCVPADGGVNLGTPITQDCLNEHVLEFDVDHARAKYPANVMPDSLQDPSEYDKLSPYIKCDYAPITGSCCNGGGDCTGNAKRWVLPNPGGDQIYDIRLKLPDSVTAERAVLQWYWQTGNSPYSYTEAFWNCADIKIVDQGTPHPTNPTPPTTPVAPVTPAPVPATPVTSPVPPPVPILNNGEHLENLKTWLNDKKAELDNNVLLYQTPSFHWIPSTVYKTIDMINGIDIMATTGAGSLKFYVGSDGQTKPGHIYGLVNVAAFLAQSLQESIHYNACDENNWDSVGQGYPLSNACGQLGQNYQGYTCGAGEEHMACEVDTQMEITAETNAKWWGAPGKLFCGPKSKYPSTGYWNAYAACDGGVCDDYEGQKGGAVVDTTTANRAGRTDVEGCCWWGRGVIQTTGICNFGKLNYYLGKKAAELGNPSAYPNIDFCKTPDAICSSTDHPELKWIAGLFYWLNSVQGYPSSQYNYQANLVSFTNQLGDSFDPNTDTSFIDAVSGIVNRGCPSLSCPAGAVHNVGERRENFKKVLSFLGLASGGQYPTVPVTNPVPSPVANPVPNPVPSPVANPVPNPVPSPVANPVPNPVPDPSGGNGDCVGRDPQNDEFCAAPHHDMCAVYPGTCVRVSSPVPVPNSSPVAAPNSSPVPAPNSSPNSSSNGGNLNTESSALVPLMAGVGACLSLAAGIFVYYKRKQMRRAKEEYQLQKQTNPPVHYMHDSIQF